jgi:hypothetical protein
MGAREQYSGRLVCPGCGRTGEGEWEENASPGPRGWEKHLIALSKGFGVKKGDSSNNPKIICKKCKRLVH